MKLQIIHGKTKEGYFAQVTGIKNAVTVEGTSEILCVKKLMERLVNLDNEIEFSRK